MAMTAGLDCGPVFHVEELDIGPGETAGELHDRLATLGGSTLVAHLDAILGGDLAAVPQDDAEATYAPKIDKQDARVDWSLSADEVARRIRAYNPFPGAFCFLGDTRIKIWRADVVGGSGAPGAVLQCDREAVVVACGDGSIRLEEAQLPGKRRVNGHDFANQLDLAGQRLD